jgi:ribosome-binding factor A
MNTFEHGSRGNHPSGHHSDHQDHHDDGVDPRTFFESSHGGRGRDRKTRMLCSQVADCLQLVLESGVSDDDLQDILLRDVEPFPDAATLRVTLTIPRSADRGRVQEALTRASGYLRSEVASTISRKRAPQLVFRVVAEYSQ